MNEAGSQSAMTAAQPSALNSAVQAATRIDTDSPGSRDVQKHGYIDALRGIAILGVMLVHSSEYVTPSSQALRAFAAFGAKGVQLFFIASAITLGMSWRSRSVVELTPVRNFLLRRFFRIAPMFYIAGHCRMDHRHHHGDRLATAAAWDRSDEQPHRSWHYLRIARAYFVGLPY
jgi:peptidoglycan/LPS O-acetylase OafA/YrhL